MSLENNSDRPSSGGSLPSSLDGYDFEHLMTLVLDAIPLKIFWKDRELRLRGCNQSFSLDAGMESPGQLLGLSDFDLPWTRSEAEFFRACDREIMERDEAEIGIIETQTSAAGEQSWVETSKVPLRNQTGEVIGILGVYHDVTEIKESENALRRSHTELEQSHDELEARVLDRTRELQHMAQHDGLTGLANRGHFLRRLNDELDYSNSEFALLFIDLDRFKTINDSLGHRAGDQLLIQVSNILEKAVRPGDVVGRFGGDEFTILIRNVRNVQEVLAISDRIQSTLRQSITIDQCSLVVTASIGIVIECSDRYESADDVLRDADIAMYEAKGNGKARHQVFTAEMLRAARERLELENDMRLGLHRNEFTLQYQPILELASGTLTGFEALVRWNHPTRGVLPPGAFLDIAEESGLIVDLGVKILRIACCQFAQWRDELGAAVGELSVNVNLSPAQMSCEDFPQQLSDTVAEFNLNPCNLRIEVTENLLLKDDDQHQELFSQLRKSGYKLMLDDFGTGFCSLSYLHRFPIDTLKIDRSFIQSMQSDSNSKAIVKTILALAKVLELKVVAEGVESKLQESMLKEMGCEHVQGFLYAEPLWPESAAEQIKRYLPGGSSTATENSEPLVEDFESSHFRI